MGIGSIGFKGILSPFTLGLGQRNGGPPSIETAKARLFLLESPCGIDSSSHWVLYWGYHLGRYLFGNMGVFCETFHLLIAPLGVDAFGIPPRLLHLHQSKRRGRFPRLFGRMLSGPFGRGGACFLFGYWLDPTFLDPTIYGLCLRSKNPTGFQKRFFA